MTPDLESAVAVSPARALSDSERALGALREQGANQLSPVDFHYMEALARRMNDQAPAVRHILESKLTQALSAYQIRIEQTQGVCSRAVVTAQSAKKTVLSQLIQSMAQHAPEREAESHTAHWAQASAPRTELKSVRHFRNTWSKLSAHKQMSQALGLAPKNAGPINSHMLVLRSLELMRDISPDYLNRFMSYADTLLCLDQADLSTKAAPVKSLASAKSKARAPTKP